MEDASLEDFLGGEDPAVGDGSDEATDDAHDPTTAWSTYVFDPAGAPCAACGAVVRRRWRREGALVCPDCTEWGE